MSSETTATNIGYDMIRTITHTASGSHIQIHPYGATLLSFCTPSVSSDGSSSSTGSNRTSVEHLFVSKHAVLDASQPIRGGVPLVFPIFGPPPSTSTMPQHGFARRNLWTFVSEENTEESAAVVYQLNLDSVEAGRGEGNVWSLAGRPSDGRAVDCHLELAVSFSATHLTTKLTMVNTGSTEAFPFHALLHTYYKVDGGSAMQADQCYVHGLEGYRLDDKVSSSGSTNEVGPEPVTIAGEVDRVYTPTSSGALQVTIGVGNQAKVTLQASAQVATTAVPVSCVVWNPYIEKAAAMADFGNDEYHDMLCVEPGVLGTHQLHPGESAWLEQTIRIE